MKNVFYNNNLSCMQTQVDGFVHKILNYKYGFLLKIKNKNK